jgi:type IV pilus assembly protein PilX
MKSISAIATPSCQRGVTLIVALIFLAILMLLGVTVAQTSSMEERMAGNTRDRDLALQAAEAALQAADATMGALPKDTTNPDPNKRGKITTAFDGTTVGYVAYDPAHGDDAAYWNAYDWPGASVQVTSASLSGLAAQPRYVIEKLPDSVNTQRFRVTARGVGSSATTVVILQAGYENN